MENEQNPEQSFYLVIPTWLFDLETEPWKMKKLYGTIVSLCKKEGYCWAKNSYLAEKVGSSERNVQRHLKRLVELNLIGKIEVMKEYGNTRKIYLKDSPLLAMTSLSSPHDKAIGSLSSPHDKAIGSLSPFHISTYKTKIYKGEIDDAKASEYSEKLVKYYEDNIGDIKQKNVIASKFKSLLRDFTVEDLVSAMRNKSNDDWWMKNAARRGPTWFLSNKTRLRKYADEE